ncbi:MAG: hypothetical protein ACRDOO_08415 [Actinomadura sp.]
MTDLHDEYGEIIRRALHAEADAVVPSADGLERIRERMNERPRFGWAWFTATWARPVMAGVAALALAAIAVSAPPAINSISTGGGGSADPGQQGQGGASGVYQPGQSGQSGQTVPGPQTSEQLSSAAALSAPPSPSPTCAPTDPEGGVTATTTSPAPTHTEPPACASTAPTPPTSPPTTTSPPTEPPGPSSEPTQEVQSSIGAQHEPPPQHP